MHAGKEVKLRRGAIWACALPMILGLAFGIMLINDAVKDGGVIREYIFKEQLMSTYMCGALLFTPPLTCLVTGLHLRRIEDPVKLKRWVRIFLVSLGYATFIHFMIYLLTLGWVRYVIGSVDKDSNAFAVYFVYSIANSIVLWIIFLVPFTAVGTALFRRVTKFPVASAVFE